MSSEATDKLRVLILSKDLDARGGVVSFLTTLMERLPPAIECDHLPVGRPLSGRGVRDVFVPFADTWRLARRVLRHRVDCVHVNSALNRNALLRDGLFMMTLALLRIDRTLFFVHGWSDEIEERIRRSRWLRFLLRNTLGRASRVLVLASRFRDSLVAMGLEPERVGVVTTMFDGRLFDSVRRSPEKKQKTILFMSRFVREKGVYELIDAFATISSRFPDVHLIMAGNGPELASIRSLVDRYRLTCRVQFPGYLRGDDKARSLVDSDVFVLPTYGEGCPVVLLEAMAAGLPVVTRAVGGILDVFADGVNGILLADLSPSAIATATMSLLEDDADRHRMGDNNRRQAWQSYEAGIVTSKLESMYRLIASGEMR